MILSKLRKKIDSIDKNILELLNQRAGITLSIGKVKAKKKASAYVPNREKEVYDNILKLNKGPLKDDTLRAVYREIMSGSLALEKSLKVSYLGPAATFTHLAALKKFGSSVKYYPASSITEIFAEVDKARADYGVVPIENSIEGAINHTLDMFTESDLVICSEISFEITHNLMSKYPLGSIKRIYSKFEVFGQCRLWLESNMPKVELKETSSTSKAAEIASGEKNSAAIGSSLAAECYGLKILAKSIEDSSHNITRFLVIGKTQSAPTAKDKTSIMFSAKDKPGALHDILVPFKKNGINMTKIESRPSKKKAWEYYFFVDLQGHAKNPKIKKALDELKKHTSVFKVLGSYPAHN
ncbi:MAG: prephenate dehydratase [Candidatus Omnitrophica bacterium CG12_big_fil_rev_8_21_14_0_65_43_15]|uniref:Bifunctional chorismate mutase/prephenate dehydratase n=1 Tax=Candidatus Taenaricola geysiri TaxID=1974752 RepID=A0A2J0LI14_9BACT|nr:MAG: chorismate mutase [Candidatus Omnitrophica bacterium CG1_02_43_210]PIR66098.1 MAG: prephenate dehydratase [Candidatus Omnitrophica bacterium CG10_big_fil_rev_8_21_14_0_10_43_8]PIV11687.1 MAG: prephenate dehydratase [Candidatus Omnitrophica bacterium CG03_land_8_20_14_0_80_43_22]PIW66504.1 MAG: prephenate dehydratase [Candidatus Omnitrophica bacterium CG12_big_fil_rev_8_21_14_0_65_43_15]PIW79984.1 MAG: prephenate dehydratase [Candidatus Omnitrophica bacterium CG_4_8_14_3_um_filter_43_15]